MTQLRSGLFPDDDDYDDEDEKCTLRFGGLNVRQQKRRTGKQRHLKSAHES